MAHSEQPKEHSIKGGIEVCIGEDCKICKERKFVTWLTEIKQILYNDCGWRERAIESMDDDAWREMFNEGLSISEAIYEEFS